MTRLFCDRCGEEIPPGGDVRLLNFNADSTWLCPSCHSNVYVIATAAKRKYEEEHAACTPSPK